MNAKCRFQPHCGRNSVRAMYPDRMRTLACQNSKHAQQRKNAVIPAILQWSVHVDKGESCCRSDNVVFSECAGKVGGRGM